MARKPLHVTYCPTCQRDDVGVWQTSFNTMINPVRGRKYVPSGPKTARHRDRAGAPCPGSGLTIPEHTVMENL